MCVKLYPTELPRPFTGLGARVMFAHCACMALLLFLESDYMDLKKPLTIEEQIERLREHGMDIADVALAQRVLSEINYYRLSGYALQFRDACSPDDYCTGTSFEEVWRIYQFDVALRALLKPYLDVVELYMRSQIAYIFSLAKCKCPPHDQHYDANNFHNSQSHNEIFSSGLSREMSNSRDTLFVIHHAHKYGSKMPLWVIVELLSFTNLSKLFRAMYNSEQDMIALHMSTTRSILSNHLHCLANLRNKVAHASRLYNAAYNPPAQLGVALLRSNADVAGNTLFAYLIVLLRRLPNDAIRSELANAVIKLVSQYTDCLQFNLIGFPEDYAAIFEHTILWARITEHAE